MFASLLLALAASAAAAPAPRAASSYSLQWSVKEDGDYVHVSTGARHGRFHGTSNFENGRPVDLTYTRTQDREFKWTFVPGEMGAIRSTEVADGEFCLDGGELPRDGSSVRLWQCNPRLAQQMWTVHNGRVELPAFKLCLDVKDGHAVKYDHPATAPKYKTAGLQLWACGESPNQEFIAVPQ